MKRAAIAIGVIIIAVAAALGWRLSPRRIAVLTDADTIREPLHAAAPRDILWQPPARLAELLNTDTEDYEPRVSWDGLTLFFVRGKAGENADIYSSQRQPAGWTEPRPLAALNSDADDLGPEPSKDGRTIVFYSNRTGGSGGYDLWMSRRTDDGWTSPQNLGPRVNSPFNDYGPALSPDGRTLYFASNRPRPDDAQQPQVDAWPATVREDLFQRDYDLYAAQIADAGVMNAVPLAMLNTPHNEGAPAVTPFGDFLYFASDRPGGLGGFDIYRARCLRGEFLPPENLGPSLNTAANELDPGLTMGGYALYFSSDRPLERRRTDRPNDYDLFYTTSREVFREDESLHQPLDWAALLRAIGPNLFWALLALLLMLLLLAFLRDARSRKLSLLMRCLLASLLAHLVLMLLFNFWEVTTSLAGLLRREGRIQVALVSAARAEELTAQIRGSLAEVAPPAPLETPLSRSESAVPEAQFAHATIETSVTPSALPEPRLPPLQSEPRDADVSSQSAPPNPPAPADAPSPDAAALALAAPPTADPINTPEPAETDRQPPVAAITVERAAPMPASSQPAAPPESVVFQPETSRPTDDATEISFAQTELPADTTPDATTSRFAAAMSSDVPPAPAAPPMIDLPRLESRQFTSHGDPAGEPAERPTAVAVQTTARAPAEFLSQATTDSTTTLADVPPGPSETSTSSTTLESLAANAAIAADASTAVLPDKSAVAIDDRFTAPRATTAVAAAMPALESAPGAAAEVPPTDERTVQPAGAAAVRPSSERLLPLDATQHTSSPIELPPVARIAPDSAADTATESIASAVAPTDADERRIPIHDRETPTPRDAAGLPTAPLALNLPGETAPPAAAFAHRAPENRDDLLQRMGGSSETERAVAAALNWLARHQSPDGHWDVERFDDDCGRCGGNTDIQANVAETGLAVLCFLGAGHTHTRAGPYQDHVRRAIDWLLARQRDDGDLRGDETMYSHGIATIALSEALGMSGDEALRRPVQRAADFIVAARNTRIGGWRYDPRQAGDTSVLGWQIMALKSARLAGVEVPQVAFDAARDWLDLVSRRNGPGLYAYQPNRRYSVPMTAEGMFVRQLLDAPRDDSATTVSVELISRHPPKWDESVNTYYWYYATLALFHHQGERWQAWNESLTRALLAHQRRDECAAGSWDPIGEWAPTAGRVYQTAICTLMLEVYYRYLPLYSAEAGAAVSAGQQRKARDVDVIGIIRGVVRDAETARPLAGATVRLDLLEGPLTVETDSDGRYELAVPRTPPHFALSAAKKGYESLTHDVASERLSGGLRLDFDLVPARLAVIALEDVPRVHHLGNDRFEGRINSQFQRDSEGTTLMFEFDLPADHPALSAATAQVALLARGVQCPHHIHVNGRLLRQRLDESPTDGSFGEFIAAFDASWLRPGANTLSITARSCNGDLDDFEFVNVRITERTEDE